MSAAISIRLPEELMRELKVVADATERSRTSIIRKAIESYLQEYVDYQIALERLRDKEDEIISGKELREQLAL